MLPRAGSAWCRGSTPKGHLSCRHLDVGNQGKPRWVFTNVSASGEATTSSLGSPTERGQKMIGAPSHLSNLRFKLAR